MTSRTNRDDPSWAWRPRSPSAVRLLLAALFAAYLVACDEPTPAPPAPALARVRLEGEAIELPASELPLGSHAVRMVIVNDGDEPARVAPLIEVLHYVDDEGARAVVEFESYEALEGLAVRETCEPPDDEPGCFTVPPRSRVELVPWLGVRRGRGQCDPCDSRVPHSWDRRAGCDLAPGGSHAFRVRTCEGGALPDGPRFTLPAPTPPPPAELCVAAGQGDLATVRRLASIEGERACALPTSFAPEGRARSNALMLAAMYGHTEIVRHLLGEGFDALERDPATGRSAYVHAAAGNHVEIVDLFWAAGARPPVDDPHIGAVLWSAATHDRRPILEHYVANGVDLNQPHFVWTALDGARNADHTELARWLVAHGARPFPETDESSATP